MRADSSKGKNALRIPWLPAGTFPSSKEAEEIIARYLAEGKEGW